MRTFRKFLWRFMVIFSFIVNLVLVVVLLGLVIFIFPILNNVADPLITGLHATSIGLDEATIDWTIPVRDRIPVVLNIPLQTDTTVVLTSAVPLNVNAVIDLPGLNANDVPAFVSITLPAGLELPVALDLNVPVDEELDVALDVRAVIPLSETQLHDPINTLGLLFEPLSRGLHNLPDNWSEVGDFIGGIGQTDDLANFMLATDGSGFNDAPYDPWLGYTRTAGLNYNLFGEVYPQQNLSEATGVVIPGGIPALDALVRDVEYDGTTLIQPEFSAQSVLPPETFNGSMAEYYRQIQQGGVPVPFNSDNSTGTNTTDTTSVPTEPEDYSIIPTPSAP